MDLDRCFRDGQLRRNLFVQQTGDDMAKDLVFTRRKQSDAFADFPDFLKFSLGL